LFYAVSESTAGAIQCAALLAQPAYNLVVRASMSELDSLICQGRSLARRILQSTQIENG
jgi:hypothetical protein